MIGCVSHVFVRLEAVPRNAVVVEVCARRRCVREPIGEGLDPSLILGGVTPTAAIAVVVRTYDARDRLVSTARAWGTPQHAYEPNGPDCPPICFVLSLRLVSGQRLLVAWA